MATVSQTQATNSTNRYDAFGVPLSQTGLPPNPFGFAGAWGYQEDASGLKLLGHRYYDPSTGRFLSRDPIQDGRNWYSYVDNNPLRWVDPEGLYQMAKFAPVRMPSAQPSAPVGSPSGSPGLPLPLLRFGGVLGVLLMPSNMNAPSDIDMVPQHIQNGWIDKGRGRSGYVSPSNGKGFNRGRGDDPAYWEMTEKELKDAIAEARRNGDTKRLRPLERIWKERFRGPRGK